MDPSSTRLAPFDYPVLDNIYNQLAGTALNGKPDPNAGLASWQISDGGKTFTFTLRKGVKFHNGDPLTTKDVEFTHNRYMEKNPSYKTDMRTFDRLEVVDDSTIKFIFKQPNALFLPAIASQLLVVSKSYYDKAGEDTFKSKPVGTGPYKYGEWKPGQYIDLMANEDYWGGAPQVKQARIIFTMEPTTKVAMLQAKEVDIIADTPYQSVAQLESAGFKTVRVGRVPNVAVQFHTLNPRAPWADKRVRQAIAYAIDRQAIIKSIFFGIPGSEAWLLPGELGYDPTIQPYPYDKLKAKQLLSDAGYPTGFEMPLYYQTGAGIAGVKDVTEAVTLYLKAVGITCKVTGIEGPQMMDNIRKWHNDTTALVVLLMTPAFANWPEPTRGLQLQFYGVNPMGMYANPQLDAIIDQALATMDDKQRGEVIKQAYNLINNEEPIVNIMSSISIYTMKTNIDYTPNKQGTRMISIKDVKVK
ncbi:MAG: hypothetical protein A2144_02000 [Chloroflexi bacterium RBG_16_50_9]|nr:MAG: hypothetical protein A2144_02000 [Chloroflexi bacterium RBG_16_50_9]